MKKEIWRAVPGYEYEYKASNLGRVKSLERLLLINNRPILIKEKILKAWRTSRGYLSVSLYDRSNIHIHRLVIAAFKGESNKEVDHINGIKDDNRIVNLRYCTRRENMHYYAKSIKHKGSSKYIGVYKLQDYQKSPNRWGARIQHDTKPIHIGLFKTEYKAHLAYQRKLRKIK